MLGNLPYEVFVGLYLNIKRARNQQAYIIALGDSLARSADPISDDIFDAMEETEEEAAELRFGTNAARLLAKARAKKGWK